MSSLVESAKKAFTTDKIVDLELDIQMPIKENPLTTDHGVKVSDTDNWCVVCKLVSAC